MLRAGTYFERGISVAIAGTATQPITISNYPGEVAVIDGGFTQFRTAPNQDWEAYNAQRGIYRSVATFANAGQVFGYFAPPSVGYQLVPYESFAPIDTDNETYSEINPFYAGGGVYWNSNDGKVYVRLSRGMYQGRLGYQVPADIDPRNTPLHVFASGNLFSFTASAAYLTFEGLTLRNGNYLMDLNTGAHHVAVRNCTMVGGRYDVVARTGTHHLTFDHLTVNGGFPPWVARSDVKRPSAAPPAHSMQGAAFDLEGSVDAVEISNSSIAGLFDAIDTNGIPTNFAVHHNQFRAIRDDVFEIASAGYAIDFHHNTMSDVASSVSWNGTGAPPAAAIGTKYVHHNVIDTSRRQLYGRDDPLQLLQSSWRGPNGDGMATERAFDTHNTSLITGPDPWKIYYNTIVGALDVDNGGMGLAYPIGPYTAAVPHEVYNNILVQTADHWISRSARVADGSQVFDGNLYYRSAVGPTQSLFKDCDNGSGSHSFFSLVDFMSSGSWTVSRANYAPGWDSSSVQADPRLDTLYRPDHLGPAATGAVDLSRRGWPNAAWVRCRGAVAPR
ncbi:MAG TPA: hypothetical protein VK348_15460 [Planctomycetota bacterium]|nr:hypothetical protein [Planctomycetota bacterium]